MQGGRSAFYVVSREWAVACAGITLSPKQVARATELARQRGLTNVSFQARLLLVTAWLLT
jgi:cyclopropane fatty-acyl-phospholipid synthase-like methyltransferase